MNTQSFIEVLESHPNQPLVFDYGDGRQVAPGYHVTEVMNVTYESMDCGGQANFWRETIVQLQGPGKKDKPEFMSTNKFLSIYNKVVASVPVQADSEVRLEYGDANSPATHYHVGSIAEQNGHLIVFLTPPGVTCKGASRTSTAACCGSSATDEGPALQSAACCGPSLQESQVGGSKSAGCC